MPESESEITNSGAESPVKVSDHVYDHVASVAAAQGPNDRDFRPEAQRLSLMYSEAGIIGNMTIVDFERDRGIGVDTNADGKADDYLSRAEFAASPNVSTNGMHVDVLNGDIVKIDPDNAEAIRIARDGDITTYDLYLHTLLNKKTMHDFPNQTGSAPSIAAYEQIDFDWNWGWLPWDGPSAKVTDVYGNTTEQSLAKSSEGNIYLRLNEQSGRLLTPDGDIITVHDYKGRHVIVAEESLFVVAGRRLLNLVDDPANSMDSGMLPADPNMNNPLVEPIKGYVVKADNSIFVVDNEGYTEEIG